MPPSTLTFNEGFDESKLRYIVENWDTLRAAWEARRVRAYDPKLLSMYLKKSKRGVVEVTHVQKNGVGRHHAVGSLSLQSFPREVRHEIAGHLFHDADMVNAQPILLYQWCKKRGVLCPELEGYVKHRDELLQIAMTAFNYSRDEAKAIAIKLINGSNMKFNNGYGSTPNWIVNFATEMKDVVLPAVMKLEPRFRKMGLAAAAKKKEADADAFENPIGSAVNSLLCTLENECLMCMIKEWKERGIVKKFGVPVFDGFMLDRAELAESGYTIEEAMHFAEASVLVELGYEVQLVEKPMNLSLNLPPLDAASLSEEVKEGIVVEDGDHASAAEALLRQLGNSIRRCNKTVYVKLDTGVWSHDPDVVDSLLLIRCAKANITTTDKNGCPRVFGKNMNHARNVVAFAKKMCPEDPDFEERIRHSCRGKIVFSNGYYDFATGVFTPDFDDIYSTVQIQRPFPEVVDEALVQEVYSRVIHSVFGDELTTPTLDLVARVMAGHIEDKMWAVFVGQRNCGKGVLIELLKSAFGRYITHVNSGNLLASESHMSTDEAKKLSWTLAMQYSRVAVMNEIKTSSGKKKLKIDGTVIKALVSGGDTMSARQNYVNEVEISIGATPILFCNDMPAITPVDTYETMAPFNMPFKFVEAAEQGKINFFKIADPSIKDFCRRKDVADAFFHIVARSYKAHKVQFTPTMTSFRESFIASDPITTVSQDFVITNDRRDKVTYPVLKEYLYKKGFGVEITNLTTILCNMGASRVKANGVRCLTCVKMIFDMSTEVEDADLD